MSVGGTTTSTCMSIDVIARIALPAYYSPNRTAIGTITTSHRTINTIATTDVRAAWTTTQATAIVEQVEGTETGGADS